MNEFSISEELVLSKIFEIRGVKVMLDSDLAELYGVETKRLNEQVKRNSTRFPNDFMFQLTEEEWNNLKSHFATSTWGGRRKRPYVFTEQGVAMLSSVLSSDIAIQVNIQIIRLFTKMRKVLLDHKDLIIELERVKKKIGAQDEQIALVFSYLKKFIHEKRERPKPIGFK